MKKSREILLQLNSQGYIEEIERFETPELNVGEKVHFIEKKAYDQIRKRSSARKRHLRDMNEKLKLYQAIADAAISDAARWHKEAQYWKLMYETKKSE